MIEIKRSKKEKSIGKQEYLRLLEEHFDLTVPFRKLYLDERLPPIERSILDYREKFTITHPKTVLITGLFFGLVSSASMGVIWIWIINDVVKYPVDYSVKNILAISSIFMLSKAKLNFLGGS
jgi:hypothetical protein